MRELQERAGMEVPDPTAIRILVVEDEVRLATFIRNALRELSFDVDIAEDGPGGLRAEAARRTTISRFWT